jgi:hypothetical protein
MPWFLLAQCFSTLIELILLWHQTERAKDLQILLLRRQLTIVLWGSFNGSGLIFPVGPG